MKILRSVSVIKGITIIVTSDEFDALDLPSQLDVLKNTINDLRIIYSDKLKEHRVVKPKTRYLEVKQRENQAMYLRMEGRTLQAVGDIMGVSRERIRQLIRTHERHCRKVAQMPIPPTHEVAMLLPYIDSIKAIYENDS
jgi:DNA-directed RNA polymerase specialized sigma subunit